MLYVSGNPATGSLIKGTRKVYRTVSLASALTRLPEVMITPNEHHRRLTSGRRRDIHYYSTTSFPPALRAVQQPLSHL